jgi:ABC-2 type transport system permease protein
MSSITALFTLSLRQALPQRRTLLLGMLEVAPAGIYLISTTNRTQEFATEGAVQVGGTIFFALVLPVVAMVIAAGILGAERRDETLSFVVLRPISRFAIAGSKMLAAITAAFALNAIGAILLATAHAVRFGDTQLFVGLLVGTLIATTAYAAIMVPLGFLTDRAVIIGMAFLLVFENGVVFALPGLASLSPWRLGMAAFGDLAPNAAIYAIDMVGNLEMSASKSFLTALLFALAGTAATTILLKTRDLA